METLSVPSSTLCLISGVANGDICFSDSKRLEPKELLWQHHWGCHFICFVIIFFIRSINSFIIYFLLFISGLKKLNFCMNYQEHFLSTTLKTSLPKNNEFFFKTTNLLLSLRMLIAVRQFNHEHWLSGTIT